MTTRMTGSWCGLTIILLLLFEHSTSLNNDSKYGLPSSFQGIWDNLDTHNLQDSFDEDDTVFAGCPFLKLALTDYPERRLDISSDLLETFFHIPNKHMEQRKTEIEGDKQDRALKRYDHYKTGSGYEYKQYRNKRSGNTYSHLNDIWLCLVCALGWTVWLVSNRKAAPGTTPRKSGVFEKEESTTFVGNVLKVSLGEDPDGTGIPVYHTLIDYCVVPTVNGMEDGINETTDSAVEPLQVRKCFTTRTLYEEGFANVKVLVLVDSPTTSMLLDDFIQSRRDRDQMHLEPPDRIHIMIVYLVATTLIVTSFFGGLHVYFRLDPEDQPRGKIYLIVGTIAVYPLALICHKVFKVISHLLAPLIQRPGVIIHGAKDYWNTKCGATLNPREILGGQSFDQAGTYQYPKSPSTQPYHHPTVSTMSSAAATPKASGSVVGSSAPMNLGAFHQAERGSVLSTVVEMASLEGQSNAGRSTTDSMISPQTSRRTSNKDVTESERNRSKSPMYPNAGCGFGNFNVVLPPRGRSSSSGGRELNSNDSVSSMSSNETGQAGNNHNPLTLAAMMMMKPLKAQLREDLPPPLPMDLDESEYDLQASATLRIRPSGMPMSLTANLPITHKRDRKTEKAQDDEEDETCAQNVPAPPSQDNMQSAPHDDRT